MCVSSRSNIGLLSEFPIDKPVPLESWFSRYGNEKAMKIITNSGGLMHGGRAALKLTDYYEKHPALNCQPKWQIIWTFEIGSIEFPGLTDSHYQTVLEK
jgi:hypothetical protein